MQKNAHKTLNNLVNNAVINKTYNRILAKKYLNA